MGFMFNFFFFGVDIFDNSLVMVLCNFEFFNFSFVILFSVFLLVFFVVSFLMGVIK